jgi:hypothetical protein
MVKKISWQFMRQNWLSNRVFKSFDDIVDHCCYAWNTLIDLDSSINEYFQRGRGPQTPVIDLAWSQMGRLA